MCHLHAQRDFSGIPGFIDRIEEFVDQETVADGGREEGSYGLVSSLHTM